MLLAISPAPTHSISPNRQAAICVDCDEILVLAAVSHQ